jgi:hypothetical protein
MGRTFRKHGAGEKYIKSWSETLMGRDYLGDLDAVNAKVIINRS